MRKLVRDRSVLIVGHADADGHLAAEQSRRNALDMGATACDVLVDPRITAGRHMWRKHLPEIPVNGADTVIFVDLMFQPADPADSAEAIAELARQHADKTFIVIDHHPVFGLPSLPHNVSLWFTPAVYTCCFGIPGLLMVIASVCDRDEGPVASMIDATTRRRALGMERAAADADLAGARLLRLLRDDRWDIIEAVAEEPRDVHRRVRGRRTRKQPDSSGLMRAHAAAG